jgi:hypothetical protein
MCCTVSGILAFQASFWALPSGFLTGNAAAGGLATAITSAPLIQRIRCADALARRAHNSMLTAPQT